jgi:AcrR family transcriptional regulator
MTRPRRYPVCAVAVFVAPIKIFVQCTIFVYTVSGKALAKPSGNRSRHRRLPSSSTWDALAPREDNSGLTRERIVAAGIAIADHAGLARVSIRGIAAQLNSSPMSLYHYVPSKRDLLNLMLDAANADFGHPAKKISDWRGVLCHFAWESRRCLKQHPWVNQLRASDPEYGPESIRILEWLLTSLSSVGLDIKTAIRVIGVLFVFVNGYVAAESSQPAARKGGGRPRAVQHPNFARAILATGNYPQVKRFIDMSSETPNDRGFEQALNLVLNGVTSEIQLRGKAFAAKQTKKGWSHGYSERRSKYDQNYIA